MHVIILVVAHMVVLYICTHVYSLITQYTGSIMQGDAHLGGSNTGFRLGSSLAFPAGRN